MKQVIIYCNNVFYSTQALVCDCDSFRLKDEKAADATLIHPFFPDSPGIELTLGGFGLQEFN